MRRVAFSVPGEPKGKGRPRAVPALTYDDNGEPKAFVRIVTPQDTRDAEAAIRAEFRRAHPGHKPFTGPVQINFTAVFETPASFNKALKAAAKAGELYAIKKPDKDNIEKLIVDALNGIAFVDDQQVMGGGIKRYGSPARIDISLREMTGAEVPATPGERRNEARMQGTLPLTPRKASAAFQTKAEKPTGDPRRIEPDLSGYDDKTRGMILRAMEREEQARLDRAKRAKP